MSKEIDLTEPQKEFCKSLKEKIEKKEGVLIVSATRTGRTFTFDKFFYNFREILSARENDKNKYTIGTHENKKCDEFPPEQDDNNIQIYCTDKNSKLEAIAIGYGPDKKHKRVKKSTLFSFEEKERYEIHQKGIANSEDIIFSKILSDSKFLEHQFPKKIALYVEIKPRYELIDSLIATINSVVYACIDIIWCNDIWLEFIKKLENDLSNFENILTHLLEGNTEYVHIKEMIPIPKHRDDIAEKVKALLLFRRTILRCEGFSSIPSQNFFDGSKKSNIVKNWLDKQAVDKQRKSANSFYSILIAENELCQYLIYLNKFSEDSANQWKNPIPHCILFRMEKLSLFNINSFLSSLYSVWNDYTSDKDKIPFIVSASFETCSLWLQRHRSKDLLGTALATILPLPVPTPNDIELFLKHSDPDGEYSEEKENQAVKISLFSAGNYFFARQDYIDNREIVGLEEDGSKILLEAFNDIFEDFSKNTNNLVKKYMRYLFCYDLFQELSGHSFVISVSKLEKGSTINNHYNRGGKKGQYLLQEIIELMKKKCIKKTSTKLLLIMGESIICLPILVLYAEHNISDPKNADNDDNEVNADDFDNK